QAREGPGQCGRAAVAAAVRWRVGLGAVDTLRPMSTTVCVYCGSRDGTQPQYANAARLLGRLIGERGWRLVYGGGKVGVMGIVADSVLAAGGEVVGVIPETLMRREVGHRGLTELHVVQTM